jgi:DNA polymerase bacteriophage-type
MIPEPPIKLPLVLGTDFESYSEANLKTVGVYRYCRHPSTEILCCSFGFTEDTVWVWRPGEPLPWQLIEYVRNGGILGAHNAAFERQMWNVQLVKYGAPPTPVNQWVCTAAQVAALAAPRRLDHAGEFFNLSQVKDTETGKILHKVCKPDRKGNKPILSVEDWDELTKYNKQDVVSELAIKNNLRPLQRSERLVWLMNEVINDRGIYVDIEFAKQARKLWETHSAQLNAKCQKLTGLNASQAEAIKDWIAKRGDPLNTLRKQAVADYLEDPTVDPDIREVLELRLEAGSAAVKKFAAFINCVDSDNRVRGTQRYHAASTGRNGGMLIQPQNMKRPSLKVNQYEHAMELVRKQDLMAIKIFYGSVSDTLGSLCRATIQAAPGYKLIAGDFSQVEARNVAWFSGQHDLLAAFASGKDAYKFMASKVFGKPPESIDDDSHERFIGKQLVLGSGYQLGGDKFHRSLMEQFGVDVGRDNALTYIKLYREANKNIVQYWYSLQREVIDTVKSGRARTFGPLGLRTQGTDWLFITLPSGRDLAYYKPTISQDRYGDKLSFFGVDNKTKRGITEQTYGGKLLENICSGFCRDLMMAALLRLEMNGYPVVLTVHDEVICEVPESFGSAKEMEQIMTVVPPWAKGFPVASKCWEGVSYRK